MEHRNCQRLAQGAPRVLSPSELGASPGKRVQLKTRFDTFPFKPISWSPTEIDKTTEAKSKVYDQLVRRSNISLD